ncbi:Uncharacterised protein [Bordetella pertussis]|nr:Uncharacterised protein [Bordetella pertussis]
MCWQTPYQASAWSRRLPRSGAKCSAFAKPTTATWRSTTASIPCGRCSRRR